MVVRCALTAMSLSVWAAVAGAQFGGNMSSARSVPAEAQQFAFLIGQFDITVKPSVPGIVAKIHGIPQLVGTWKGWRALDGFGIEDELRITDEAGNPRLLSHAVRYFDADAKHWVASSIDVYRGVFSASTAQWKNNVMIVTSRGMTGDGRYYVARASYSAITPTSFHFQQDRSFDEGRSWEDGVLTIDATRVAAVAPR
jgi:hypothetical protein